MSQSLFERNASTYFLTLEDGRTIFYPSGVFGRRGYAIDTPAREHQLRRAAWRFNVVLVIGCLAFSIPFGLAGVWLYPASGVTLNQLAVLAFALLAAIAVIGWLVQIAYFRRYTRGLPRVSIPNRTAEQFRRMGTTMNPRFLQFGKYYLLLFVLTCLVIAVVRLNLFALLLAACMFPSLATYWVMGSHRLEQPGNDGKRAA